MTKFSRRPPAKAFLVEAIRRQIADASIAEILVEGCLSHYREYAAPPRPPGGTGLIRPRQCWVIRDEDLKLDDGFWKAVASAATVNFFTSSATISAVIGLVSAAYGVLRAARRKGAYLTLDQCRAVLVLKKIDVPCSARDVAALLEMPLDLAEEILKSLTAVRCADGTLIAVAQQDANALWACAGV